MPVEFLNDEQAAAYGSFDGPPSQAELERFFSLMTSIGGWLTGVGVP